MAKKRQKVLHRDVLSRFMQEDELSELYVRYNDALKYHGGKQVPEPSDNDMRIASHVRETKNYYETAKALGITDYKVMRAVARVAAWEK